jgi:hypothetical protein
MLEPILKKLSTIASGATPIGRAGHAPDTDESINFSGGEVTIQISE